MHMVEDAETDVHMAIEVELAPGVEAADALAELVADRILAQLLRLDAEFAAYVPKECQRPRITLRPSGDAEYFPAGVKHRYSRIDWAVSDPKKGRR